MAEQRRERNKVCGSQAVRAQVLAHPLDDLHAVPLRPVCAPATVGGFVSRWQVRRLSSQDAHRRAQHSCAVGRHACRMIPVANHWLPVIENLATTRQLR